VEMNLKSILNWFKKDLGMDLGMLVKLCLRTHQWSTEHFSSFYFIGFYAIY